MAQKPQIQTKAPRAPEGTEEADMYSQVEKEVQELKNSGATRADIWSTVNTASGMGLITTKQATQLIGKYGSDGTPSYRPGTWGK